MAGYQFIHYEAYGRKGSSKKRSLASIAREAERVQHSHPHVESPQPPEYLLGTSFVTAAQQIADATDDSTTVHGGKPRKVRADANTGIGLIASYPLSVVNLKALPEEQRQLRFVEIQEWAEDTIAFAQSEFPGLVQVAALHWDESYPHIHILVGSTAPSHDFKQLHKGELARRAAQGNDRSGQGKKAGNDAYKAEMRRFQDRYHKEVAIHYGQARLGPRRNRLTRSEWRHVQTQAEALANAKKQADIVDQHATQVLADAQTQSTYLVEATQQEARVQLARIAQEKERAEKQYRQAQVDAQAATQARKMAEEAKFAAQELVEKFKPYETLAGRILGFFGLKKLIERRAEKRWKEKTKRLNAEIDRLTADISRLHARRRESGDTKSALNALIAAVKGPVGFQDQLSGPEPVKAHFEQIQHLLAVNHTNQELVVALSDYADQLKVTLHDSTVKPGRVHGINNTVA